MPIRPWYRRGSWLAALAGALLALAATAVVLARTNAPAAVYSETPIPCDLQEMSAEHIHAHLQIYIRGQQRIVPANVGIRSDCLFWLHTHDATGLIHVEAGARGTYALGQFFGVWGQPLSMTELLGERTQPGEEVRVLVDGQPYPGNPRAVPLRAHEEIVLELGPPFPSPAPFTFPPGT